MTGADDSEIALSATRPSSAIPGIAVIALAVALPAITYVGGLGFYSDDWAFIHLLHSAPDQSFTGIYRELAKLPNVAVRPGQIVWYAIFDGLNPGAILAVHIANHVVFALGGVILYLALRSLGSLGGCAFTIALIYVCMPQFSAERVWYANHQSSLSFLFFALTLLFLARDKGRSLAGAIGIFASTAASLLCYEFFGFILLAAPALIGLAGGLTLRALPRDRTVWRGFLAVASAFVATMTFKLAVGGGLGTVGMASSPGNITQFAGAILFLFAKMAWLVLLRLGLFLPGTSIAALSGHFASSSALAVALAVGALVYLLCKANNHVAPSGPVSTNAKPSPFALMSAGAVVFMLGVMPFVPNLAYYGAAWGEGSRGHVGAAFGGAIMAAGAVEWVFRRNTTVGALVMAVYCAAGVGLLALLGQTWAKAAHKQTVLVSAATRIDPASLSGRTLLLFRTCPFFGSGPIFPYGWDFERRLQVESGDLRKRADVITDAAWLGVDGLHTVSDVERVHPYTGLLIYDLRAGDLRSIDSPGEARTYFGQRPIKGSTGCKFANEIGVPLY
jgi:hypothetical protein